MKLKNWRYIFNVKMMGKKYLSSMNYNIMTIERLDGKYFIIHNQPQDERLEPYEIPISIRLVDLYIELGIWIPFAEDGFSAEIPKAN